VPTGQNFGGSRPEGLHLEYKDFLTLWKGADPDIFILK
jgi:hypothetical protein